MEIPRYFAKTSTICCMVTLKNWKMDWYVDGKGHFLLLLCLWSLWDRSITYQPTQTNNHHCLKKGNKILPIHFAWLSFFLHQYETAAPVFSCRRIAKIPYRNVFLQIIRRNTLTINHVDVFSKPHETETMNEWRYENLNVYDHQIFISTRQRMRVLSDDICEFQFHMRFKQDPFFKTTREYTFLS